MLEGEKSKSTVGAVDVTMKPMSSVGGPAATSTAVGHLAPIQQQPSGKPKRVRDELDPAPHHTAADIRVLEILKRIRDSGGVGDEDLDIPPPKRKSGRTKVDRTAFTRQTPPPVLPQQQSTAAASSTKIPINHFNLPISNRLDGIRIKPTTTVTIPSQLKNGAPPSGILLASKNETAAPVTSSLNAADSGGFKAAALLRQKPPMAQAVAVAQQTIGLELILPNGLRIPVSATCAKSEGQLKPTATTLAALASTGVSPPSASINKLASIPPPAPSTMTTLITTTTTTTTLNASQQMCSCSRSKCLKLYCDCFAAGKACGDGCNCRHCYNNLADDISKHTRDVAVRTALSRNPLAFKPKIENTGKHVLGCRCKRSHCLKGYCECYLAKIPCNQRCRCLSCSNEEASEIPGTADDTTAVAEAVSTVCTEAMSNMTGDATVTGAESVNEQQVTAAAAIVAASGPSTTATTDSACATTIATASSIASAFTTPRTITLKVPIKALAPVNGPGKMASQMSVPADLPPFLHQSYLAAAAASATRGTCPTQQDLLKCLRTVLPPIQPRPQPRLQPPMQLQTPSFVVQTPMSTSRLADTSVLKAAAVSPSNLPPSPSVLTKGDILENTSAVTHDASVATPQTSPPGDLTDVSGNQNDVSVGDEEEEERGDEVAGGIAEDDDYSGYTEEELAFMQRLQQDRSTIAAPATNIDQYPDTTATYVTASLSAALRSTTRPPIKPLLQEPEITIAPVRSVLARPERSVHTPSHSAPPSLCPDPEERLPDGRCSNHVEVHFMRRKIDELETQISQLTQLIHTQGEMLGLLLSQQQRPQE